MSLDGRLRATVRDVKDFPKEGILFKDITPVLANADLCREIVNALYYEYFAMDIDAVAGIESRGFFFGFLLANRLGKPFIPIRKAGKLPFDTVSVDYGLEYGKSTIEMNVDAVTKGMKVLVHDDLLATGGSAAAAAELVQMQGGEVVGFSFIIELEGLGGSNNLSEINPNVYSIIKE